MGTIKSRTHKSDHPSPQNLTQALKFLIFQRKVVGETELSGSYFFDFTKLKFDVMNG